MRKVLSGLAVVALACATGTAAFAQTSDTTNGANGTTTAPPSSGASSQYPTSAQGVQTFGHNGNAAGTNENGSMNNGSMNTNVDNDRDNDSGSLNGSVNGAGTTGAPVEAMPGSTNANGQTMVDVHSPTWEYEMMARQYHWNAPPPRTGGATTRMPQ